jgi:hypothetical protein
MYRQIINNKHVEKLQIHLKRLGEWASENEIINPSTRKALCFTRASDGITK